MGRSGRELQVQLLLEDRCQAVVALSETEIPKGDSVVFKNYRVFHPLCREGKGFRLLLRIREDVAAMYNTSVIKCSNMEIWVKMETQRGVLAVCSVYRQWSGAAPEELELNRFCDTIGEIFERFNHIVILGDMNLDVARRRDHAYYRRKMLRTLTNCLEENGLLLTYELDMSPTFYSHGTFLERDGTTSQKSSILDHVYYKGLPTPSFSVVPISTTDHRPTLTMLNLRLGSSGLKQIRRRKFKSISTPTLCCAINAEALSRVFAMEDVEEIHEVIVDEMVAALDLVAPLEQVQIKRPGYSSIPLL